MDPLPYQSLPAPPERVSGTAVLARLVEGLAFRYHWATADLQPPDGEIRPAHGSRSLRELMEHIHVLVAWVDRHTGGSSEHESTDSLDNLRRTTLQRMTSLAGHLRSMDDEQLAGCTIRRRHATEAHPFWNMIHGPLADALTHVGQINAWRRVAGRPAPAADVFRGRPPQPS